MAAESREICLVTPGHLATNPRLVKEADALHEAGFRVTVVASRFVQWADIADREFDERPWKVIRCSFGPLAPPVVRLRQRVARRLRGALWRRIGGSGTLAEGAFHPVADDLRRLAGSVRADLFIAHNLAALPAAGRAAAKHRGRLGFDAEDYHLGELGDESEFDSQRRLVRAIEGAWLPLCAHRTAASPGIARSLAEAYGTPPATVVLNVFPLDNAPTAPLSPVLSPSPAIYWFSQTIGPDRGLECAVKALALAKSAPRLSLRGNQIPAFGAHLRTLAREIGVEHRLELLPPCPPRDLVREAASHAIGFAGESGTSANRRVALSNKIFTFLLAGAPVALSATPAQAEIAMDLGAAAKLFQAEEPTSLAAALDELLLDQEALQRARTEAWGLARSRYCWDLEKEKFLTSVEEALR